MGKLYVVGMGPGSREDMTLRADRALRGCGVIVGYHVYVDLIKDEYPGKEYLTTPMTREADRCRMALERARGGASVAMVCSGDSGIYGMAALIYELRGTDTEPDIEVIPGLTAACSGGAVLGAPLTHDFAVISLSDRLTPWETIEKRLEAAAAADLTTVLYNPVSHGRPDHLRRACEILLRRLPEDRLCGIVRNIGRAEESSAVMTLGELKDAEADMFCTVFIGNASSSLIGGRFVTPRGYRDV
ncbi:MAG: precorrin-3B C(17)-methyltransferase [Oscillospiraceae bacterium]|nr:precorrin-3B C(17)-methyltransferase [Oscillospiraceae bacterium]